AWGYAVVRSVTKELRTRYEAVTLPASWVASTKPEAAIVRRQGWQPWQGRAWTLAQRDRGPASMADLARQATNSTRSITASELGLSAASVSVPSIESTASMPSVTRPKTVCLPSSQGAASVVTMKNWLPFVFGPALAMANAPRSTLWSLNSSSNVYPGPPVPVPVGSPPWIMKSGITRWKTTPS